MVDALGRYRCPAGWPGRTARPPIAAPSTTAAISSSRGASNTSTRRFSIRAVTRVHGLQHLPRRQPDVRRDPLVPTPDRELRLLRHEAAWQALCAAIEPLDLMTSPEYGRPITGVMPMGGLTNIDRTGNSGMPGVIAVGDAFCHTDPAFAYGCRACASTSRWATPLEKLRHRSGRGALPRGSGSGGARAPRPCVRWTPRVPDA